MSASYKIEVGCHCAPKDPLACQIHSADPVTRAAAWQYRCELAEKSLASEEGAGRGEPGSLTAAYNQGYRRGIMAGVEGAANSLAYHCDCKHADIPGVVRLLADPSYEFNILSPPSPSTPAESEERP